jgi:transposase
MVLRAASNDAAIEIAVGRIGPALVFERLWEETGCRAVVSELAGKRKHGFALERAVFLTVLHRLFVSGSDRAADRWREDYAIAGVEGLDLHHLYRAMAWLGEELPEKEQDGRTPFAPRCVKDVAEERLFAHRRDLLTRLDLVFMDTTSLSFEGAGGQTLGQHGYSKDHRPDLRQMILAVLIDGDGRPVCSEMWPGNTADVTALIPVIDRLRRRFDIARVCVVADRGTISTESMAELEARRLLYILGVRERSDKLVRELVLDDPAPFVPLVMKKRGKEIDYEAKTVMLAGRRYIVCRNRQEAEKDAADRASIVAALEHFAIDPEKIEAEKKFDGIFVLRTNTDLNPLEAMLCYKQLWTVEQTFRTAKHLFSTRPIFHKLDETIRGHVFCSFLALMLKSELEERIAGLGRSGSWPQIIADLDSLTETEIEYDGKRFIVRSAPRPAASLALRATGVALPPTVRDAAAS